MKVCKNYSAQETLVAAKKKHAKHEQFFAEDEEYVLYPDQKVVTKVPGTEEEFTVAAYKRELSKPFSKLDLFLCKAREYDNQQVTELGRASHSGSFCEEVDKTDMCVSNLHDSTSGLTSDIAALKELFPETGDLAIKRALENSPGSRDQAAVQ